MTAPIKLCVTGVVQTEQQQMTMESSMFLEAASKILICRFRVDEKRNNTISHLLCSRCV